ncbi:MAG: ATP synthase F1 subunit epsilon [Lachnospiraceae bacterium]|nr:ATP synthase F1 subunit epsilon [Lachnospiraceae bacterium]
MTMNTFHLQIITCDRIFFDGDCESLIFPGFDGQIEILAHHAPMATTVAVGEVRFRDAKGTMHAVIVSDGTVNTADNEVTLLAFSAERPEEIDAHRAQVALEIAREEMQQKQSIVEYNISSAAMARAMARLSGAKSIHPDDFNT